MRQILTAPIQWRGPRTNRGFTLVELLVVIAIIGALVGLLLPAVQAAREAGRRTTCQNNLKQMGLALHNYHDARDQFPLGLAGSETTQFDDDGLGWAVSLLPFLEEETLFDFINPDFEPGVFLRTFRETGTLIPGGDTVLDVFRCPTSNLPSHVTLGSPMRIGYATSDYKACNGQGDSGMFFKVWDGFRVGYTRVRAADVTDGLSKTLAFGESSYYTSDIKDWPIWIGGVGTDESVLFKTQPPSILNCGISEKTIEGFRRALDDDCAFSWHEGGAYFTFADGSVHFLKESIDFATYQHLGTKNDGFVLQDFD